MPHLDHAVDQLAVAQAEARARVLHVVRHARHRLHAARQHHVADAWGVQRQYQGLEGSAGAVPGFRVLHVVRHARHRLHAARDYPGAWGQQGR